MAKKFKIYFPWIFIPIDFLVCLISLSICNFALHHGGLLVNVDYAALIPLTFLWLMVSTLRKDYKLIRKGELELSWKQLLKTLFWFICATAILWLPVRTPSLQVVPIAVLGIGLLLLMGMFRTGIIFFMKSISGKEKLIEVKIIAFLKSLWFRKEVL